MQTGESAFIGHAPTLMVRSIEQTKYERMWSHERYRDVAPGEDVAPLFLAHARPKHGSTVIDFGAGTGRGALSLALFGGVRVQMLDFAANCLDEDVRNALVTQPHALTFLQHDLMQPVPLSAQHGYCTDVMEHIPTTDVNAVLGNVLKAAQHVFFQISCEDDVCGKLIGQPLHLTVQPYAWWLKKLQEFDCVVHWSQDFTSHCCFYVTAWQDAKTFVDHGVVNTSEEQMLANVRENLKAGWQEVSPHVTNDQEVLILAGGPSLANFEDEIRARRAAGAKLVTLNGTYHWALERGLVPSAQIIVDAREFNARFTHPVTENCRYLIASQAHPTVLEGLPHERTYLWHTTMQSLRETVNAEREVWYGIPGGSTVMLRAIPLMRLLGFTKFHLFGFDSCLEGGAHHAYAQAENDRDIAVPVTCGERVFRCTPWMASQAAEFMELVRFLGDEVELEVYGDGLIAHILNTSAALADAEIH